MRCRSCLEASVVLAADAASLFCVMGLLLSMVWFPSYQEEGAGGGRWKGGACDEIYVVREGETLHTISAKCGDPYIVERNPHIQDPDDVFPGLVIKIVPAGKF